MAESFISAASYTSSNTNPHPIYTNSVTYTGTIASVGGYQSCMVVLVAADVLSNGSRAGSCCIVPIGQSLNWVPVYTMYNGIILTTTFNANGVVTTTVSYAPSTNTGSITYIGF